MPRLTPPLAGNRERISVVISRIRAPATCVGADKERYQRSSQTSRRSVTQVCSDPAACDELPRVDDRIRHGCAADKQPRANDLARQSERGRVAPRVAPNLMWIEITMNTCHARGYTTTRSIQDKGKNSCVKDAHPARKRRGKPCAMPAIARHPFPCPSHRPREPTRSSSSLLSEQHLAACWR